MGANAQTTVPLFVANTVLTAATQNISAATGIPVFATTVTRDAAFGGSNKVLAEGQLCYIEASDVVQYYTGSAWATVGPTTSAVSAMDANYVATSQTTTSGTYVGLATAQVVTITTGTKALVTVSCNSQNTTGGAFNYMGFAIGGATTTAAADGYAAFERSDSGYAHQLSATFPVVLNAGSNTFTAQFKTNAGTGVFLNRTIAVIAYS